VKNLPKRFDLNWVFNEKRINAPVLTAANGSYGNAAVGKTKRHHPSRTFFINEEEERADRSEQLLYNHRHQHQRSRRHHKRSHHEIAGLHGYTIFNQVVNNVTVSRLKITDLSDAHRGVYKCRYDKIETKLTLDLKGHLKSKLKMFDYVYASGNGGGRTAASSLVLRNSEFIVLVCAVFTFSRFFD
jgi:hypothetical protein